MTFSEKHKNRLKALLLSGYLIPFVFLAMNEDAQAGSLWFYLVMIVGFGALCYGSGKIKSLWIVVVGNILSFASSCIFAWNFQTEKWEYYFKPFLPNQLIIFETVIAFLVQIICAICICRKACSQKRKGDKSNGTDLL